MAPVRLRPPASSAAGSMSQTSTSSQRSLVLLDRAEVVGGDAAAADQGEANATFAIGDGFDMHG